MSATDDFLRNNAEYAAGFDKAEMSPRPARKVAVVTCMDARLDVFSMLGLNHGDAHIIRNAGGVVTDGVIRSLTLSQRTLGTEEIVLIHHTDCGLRNVSEDAVKDEIEADTGIRPPFALESFTDTAANVRQSIKRVQVSPFLPSKAVRGFVFDVKSGRLEEVE